MPVYCSGDELRSKTVNSGSAESTWCSAKSLLVVRNAPPLTRVKNVRLSMRMHYQQLLTVAGLRSRGRDAVLTERRGHVRRGREWNGSRALTRDKATGPLTK